MSHKRVMMPLRFLDRNFHPRRTVVTPLSARACETVRDLFDYNRVPIASIVVAAKCR